MNKKLGYAAVGVVLVASAVYAAVFYSPVKSGSSDITVADNMNACSRGLPAVTKIASFLLHAPMSNPVLRTVSLSAQSVDKQGNSLCLIYASIGGEKENTIWYSVGLGPGDRVTVKADVGDDGWRKLSGKDESAQPPSSASEYK